MVKLFIGNLPDGMLATNDDVRPLFEQFGNVGECEVIRNYGFVHVESEEMATKCIEHLNGKDVKGRPMKVEKSESKGPKKPSQKMFIGNVANGTTSEELKALFETYAEVIEADAISGKNYGFVHIDSTVGRQKINQIVKDLDGYELNGNKLRVQLSTSGLRTKPGMAGEACFSFRGRGGPPRGHFIMGGPPRGRGRGGMGGPHMAPPMGPIRGRGGRGAGRPYGHRSAPYPPPRGGSSGRYSGSYGGGVYNDFAEDSYEPRRGGGPARGGRGGYGGFGSYSSNGNQGRGGGSSSMYSRRSPNRSSGAGGAYGGGGYGGGGYSDDYY